MTQDFTNDVVGAIKVKDGLFIGDEFAAQDLEFVVANKVTHVINCAGRQVPNHWEPIAVSYMTYFWTDSDEQVVMDAQDRVAKETFDFIEAAYAKSESTLIHSVKGQGRACSLCAAYLMRKHRWTLNKTLEFLRYRRPDLDIRSAFVQQLANYEARLIRCGLGPKTASWSEVYEPTPAFENEELLLRNTFINAHLAQIKAPPAAATMCPRRKKSRHLQWANAISSEGGAVKSPDPATVIPELDTTGIDPKEQQRIPVPRLNPAPCVVSGVNKPRQAETRKVGTQPESRPQSSKPVRKERAEKEREISETKKDDVMDFLQELREISELEPKPVKEIRPVRSGIQKENAPTAAPQPENHRARIVKKLPLTEESNFSVPIHKVDPKPLRTSQRCSSASVHREQPQSRKEPHHSAKKEVGQIATVKMKRDNSASKSREGNRNSLPLAFYSFKQTPATIGGATYTKAVASHSIRCPSKNCLNTNPTSAIKAVPVVGHASLAHVPRPEPPKHRHRDARLRPASPGVRGKTIESPYINKAYEAKKAAINKPVHRAKAERRLAPEETTPPLFRFQY